MSNKAYDLVVLGSGAAGLTAALTAAEHGAKVLVVEKGQKLGGTSAWSGGQIWIPCNPHQQAFGKEDSREKALTYLASMSNGLIEPQMAEAYIDGGVEMVAFLEDRTPVKFMVVPDFPDYHPEQPGAASRGGAHAGMRRLSLWRPRRMAGPGGSLPLLLAARLLHRGRNLSGAGGARSAGPCRSQAPGGQ